MTTWLNLVVVAAGGALGSVSRYLITLTSAAIPGGSSMLGTTVANILGCAAIGALLVVGEMDGAISERTALALRVGFLGGLTTFSSFAADSWVLANDGRWAGAGLFVGANLFIGWGALFLTAAVVKGWMAT